jgi:flagellar hook-length control protein FliK
VDSVTASSASALAATVTAMHQSGQSGAVLRLDPPGLGNLSVHVALGQQGQVNVLFVPDSAAGAQALQSGLGGLAQSMAQSGLSLGQAQVGGQFGQNAGQGGQGWQGGGTSSTPQPSRREPVNTGGSGVSAYA